MEPDEYALLVNGELEAVVSGSDAKNAVHAVLYTGAVTLAKEDSTGGYEEIDPDEYERLGL